MKKSLLTVVGMGLLALAACTGGEKREGYESAACREKCQRLGQTVAVAASANAGRCICLNESARDN